MYMEVGGRREGFEGMVVPGRYFGFCCEEGSWGDGIVGGVTALVEEGWSVVVVVAASCGCGCCCCCCCST